MTTARPIHRHTPDADYRVVAYAVDGGLRFGLAERLLGAPHFYAVQWQRQLHPFDSRTLAQAQADNLRFKATGAPPMHHETLKKAIAADSAVPSGTTRRVYPREQPIAGAEYTVTLVKMSDGSNKYGLAERRVGTKARNSIIWRGKRAPWTSREQAQAEVSRINSIAKSMCS